MSDFIYNLFSGIAKVLEFLIPYMKYILFLIFIIGFIWANKIFIENETLRPLLIQSFEDETGRISGKSISAFVCVIAVIMGWFIAILSSPKHEAPEYYFWGILGLISALYGIKEIGRVATSKPSSLLDSGISSTTTTTQTLTQESNTVLYDDALLLEWKNTGTTQKYSDWYKNKTQTQSEPAI